MSAPQPPPDKQRSAEGRRPWERPTVKCLGKIRDIVHNGEKSKKGED